MRNSLKLIPKINFFKNGNKIHIKKSHRGKFTRYCGGEVTEECIRKGKSSNNPSVRKLAIFAENARGWNHKKKLVKKNLMGDAISSITANAMKYSLSAKNKREQEAKLALQKEQARQKEIKNMKNKISKLGNAVGGIAGGMLNNVLLSKQKEKNPVEEAMQDKLNETQNDILEKAKTESEFILDANKEAFNNIFKPKSELWRGKGNFQLALPLIEPDLSNISETQTKPELTNELAGFELYTTPRTGIYPLQEVPTFNPQNLWEGKEDKSRDLSLFSDIKVSFSGAPYADRTLQIFDAELNLLLGLSVLLMYNEWKLLASLDEPTEQQSNRLLYLLEQLSKINPAKYDITYRTPQMKKGGKALIPKYVHKTHGNLSVLDDTKAVNNKTLKVK